MQEHSLAGKLMHLCLCQYLSMACFYHNSHGLHASAGEVSRHLQLQVDEMEKAVDVAEKNMNRFGLTTQEIRSRRQWVHDTRRTVSSKMSVDHAQTCITCMWYSVV